MKEDINELKDLINKFEEKGRLIKEKKDKRIDYLKNKDYNKSWFFRYRYKNVLKYFAESIGYGKSKDKYEISFISDYKLNRIIEMLDRDLGEKGYKFSFSSYGIDSCIWMEEKIKGVDY